MNNLLKISYIKMNIKMRAEGFAELPEWTGSTIRGAIGTELLSALCIRGDGEYRCGECAEKCSAGILYASGSEAPNEQSVSPYIVSAGENSFDGENIEFGITLFSEGVKAAEDVLKILKKGLMLGASRVRFRLESVEDAVTDDVIYDGLCMIRPEIHEILPEYEYAEKLYVEFLTPYKTKVSAREFGFEQLVRAMLRRISTVMRLEGTEPDFDYQLLVEKASHVKLKYEDLRFVKTQRYSNRSESKMEVCGFTGMMVFEGDITPFMPLIRITEIIHAGKMCVMGLGEIKVCVLAK